MNPELELPLASLRENGGGSPQVSPFWDYAVLWYQLNKKESNNMFNIIEIFSTLEWTKKGFKASFETFI